MTKIMDIHKTKEVKYDEINHSYYTKSYQKPRGTKPPAQHWNSFKLKKIEH